MAWFPKIAQPCPHLERLDEVMDGDFCRMCERQVHDLTEMDDTARKAFMAEHGGNACVSYTRRLSPGAAAAALAASAVVAVAPGAATAQRHKPHPRHPVQARPHPVRVVPPPQLYATAGVPAPILPAEKPAPVPPPDADRPTGDRPNRT